MITRIFTVILTLIILPITLLFGVLRGIVVALKGGMVPLEQIIEKGRFFLKPQISLIEKSYENKFSVITWESLVYAVGIGEELTGRPILDEEVFPYLVSVYGNDFEPRITHLLDSLQSNYEPGAFNKIKSNMRSLVKDDAKNGMINCSNFLVTNAQEVHDDLQNRINALNS
ncbi:hypothetical protein [uncultured Cycloclasticus sp.]|uniref:hypothetical protein n=1 Tax=uncultured Cycloclasticus sp. TaxID=172194 RepID=UPI002587857D|nr:hypothetical protein [uncultured Cycloclasticus sp.]